MEKADKKQLKEKALQGAAAETIHRYGSAVKQHVVAYTGKNAGKELRKGLKSISESKISKDYYDSNIKQQAGFAAEVKSIARKNAKLIVDGKLAAYVRKDDLASAANDQIVDISMVDELGNEIASQAAQMKFVGNNSSDLLNKLLSPKYHKYIEENVFLDIADDNYEELMAKDGLIDQKIEALKGELNIVRNSGKTEEIEKKEQQIKDCEHLKKKLRKSDLTRDEAIKARLHPMSSTAKDVIKLANQAGLEQAKYGAIISGSISIVKNVTACAKGEIEPKEAARQVVKDTGQGAGFSYATAFAGSVAKGIMENSASEYVRTLANTNLAAGLVSTTVNVGKTMTKYFRGDISGIECVETLGEKGFGEIGSAMYATLASAMVQGTSSVALKVVAGMAGSTLGYMAATAVYKELSKAIKEFEFAKEERILVAEAVKESISMILQYRKEMTECVEKYLCENGQVFLNGFEAMDDSIMANDIDGFISGNVVIQKAMGREVQFSNQDEFNQLMESEESFKL